MMDAISILGVAACSPNPRLRAKTTFPLLDIERESIPPLLRRRSSQATQLAFTVASTVCRQSGRSPADLPTIFASVAGEIQTTDQLCIELTKPDGVISPGAFHNSVQNTAAGYWSIASACRQAATAISAGEASFAMALLEAWCQLACHGGELLLIAYDESWPSQLAPDLGEPAFACALLLAAGDCDSALARLGKPGPGDTVFSAAWLASAQAMPILAAMPLLEHLSKPATACEIAISATAPGWHISVTPQGTNR